MGRFTLQVALRRDIQTDEYLGIFVHGGTTPGTFARDKDLIRVTKHFLRGQTIAMRFVIGEIPARAGCVGRTAGWRRFAEMANSIVEVVRRHPT